MASDKDLQAIVESWSDSLDPKGLRELLTQEQNGMLNTVYELCTNQKRCVFVVRDVMPLARRNLGYDLSETVVKVLDRLCGTINLAEGCSQILKSNNGVHYTFTMDGLELFVPQRKTLSNLMHILYERAKESGAQVRLPYLANTSGIGDYATVLAYLDLLKYQGFVNMNKDKVGYAMALTPRGTDLGKYITQTAKAEGL